MQSIDLNDYTEQLLMGNRQACSKLIRQAIKNGYTVEDVYEKIFRPSLYRVGELWEQNKISVAAEHLATAITESLMIELYPMIFSSNRIGRKIVVTSIADELHQIGAKMIADVFEMNGWDTFFLGANTPREELLTFIEEQSPDVVALSISIYFNFNNLLETISQIHSKFPKLKIIVGGQAFLHGGKDKITTPNTFFLENIDQVKNFIKNSNF